MAELHITGDAEADRLLSEEPLALLVGMLLDQQVPMETAFAGPAKIKERLGAFDAATIARADPEKLVEVFKQTPAVHRFPGSMANRTQQLCRYLVDECGGDAAAVWTGAADGADLVKRLGRLPGFGKQKAQIFAALLAKQLGVQPAGWREATGAYGEPGVFRSVADITDDDSLARVREYKKQMKAAAKAAKATS